MKYQAQWGPKGFLVSPEKIVTFDGFSTSIELNDDSENDTSGTTPTNAKGIKPQNINLSITYARAAGVDPRAQFEEWSSLVGQKYPFYIAGKRFGPGSLRLKKVDLSDLQLSNDGTFLNCTVAVSFEEYTPTKKTTTPVEQDTPGTQGTQGTNDTKGSLGTRFAQRFQSVSGTVMDTVLDMVKNSPIGKEEAMEENYEGREPLIVKSTPVKRSVDNNPAKIALNISNGRQAIVKEW